MRKTIRKYFPYQDWQCQWRKIINSTQYLYFFQIQNRHNPIISEMECLPAKMVRMRSDSMSSRASSEFSSGGASSTFSASSGSSISVKDYTTKIKTLQQENFDLRLRIFLLEEKLGKQTQNLKLQMKSDDNQRPINVRRFFSYQRPQSYEDETERQVLNCS